MHPSVLVPFALALAVAVALPGPGIFAVVSCALGRGLREALALIVGVILGDLVYFSFTVLGLAALARTVGELFIVAKLAGAAYLVWLGIKLWRRPPMELREDSAAAAPRNHARSVLGGFLLTIGNPKTIVFYAGLLPTFVDLPKLTLADALAMGVIVVLTAGLILAAYALAAAGSRRFFRQPARMKVLNRTAGTVLIGSGVAVVTR